MYVHSVLHWLSTCACIYVVDELPLCIIALILSDNKAPWSLKMSLPLSHCLERCNSYITCPIRDGLHANPDITNEGNL